MTQMAGVTTVAIGVVFVLLLGEIDLSIGYVSGIAGVVVAELQVPDASWEVKGVIAIAIAVTVTSLIGGLQGSFVAFIGVPSFVVTLAGTPLLAGRDPLRDRRRRRDHRSRTRRSTTSRTTSSPIATA